MNTPLHPILYSKSGVYRGIHYFLIFALKHILWVLVRTASFQLKIVIFTAVKYRSILHGRVFVMRFIKKEASTGHLWVKFPLDESEELML